METKEQFYKVTAEKVIENLKKRQMEGYYCETKEQAADLALSFVKEGMSVSNGGSVTLEECGILDLLSQRDDITFFDRRPVSSDPDKLNEVLHKAYCADVYFMSTNAITLDGQLVNIDGTGGRTSCLIYGPKSVVVVAGMNKVCADVESAYKRVKNIAAPPNAMRLERKTPCAMTGKCGDCQSAGCICCNTVVTRRSAFAGRIKVILVGEVLGY